jgi:hypothetical protein
MSSNTDFFIEDFLNDSSDFNMASGFSIPDSAGLQSYDYYDNSDIPMDNSVWSEMGTTFSAMDDDPSQYELPDGAQFWNYDSNEAQVSEWALTGMEDATAPRCNPNSYSAPQPICVDNGAVNALSKPPLAPFGRVPKRPMLLGTNLDAVAPYEANESG